MNERTEQEMEELNGRCRDAENEGSKYPGMSYEQGVIAALDWMQDHAGDPLDE